MCCAPYPTLKNVGREEGERMRKKGSMWVSKWHQKYLRFIMTTDISLFDICVGCPALKSARQLIPPPLASMVAATPAAA